MGSRKPTLALDFDGVIHKYTGWNDGALDVPLDGAVEFVRQAVQVFTVVVVSSRCNTDDGFDEVVAWLKKHDFPEDVTVANMRPPAYVSLDDRALTFTGEWSTIDSLMAFTPWWKSE